MPNSSAGLGTLGRSLIAAGLASSVCAVLLDERDLLRIGAFAVCLPLLAALHVRLTRRSVTASRTVSPARVSVGDETRAELRLSSEPLLRGRLARLARARLGGTRPGGTRLMLTDALPDALGHAVRLAVLLPRGQSEPTTLRYPITPLVRGRHHIGPLTVRFSDPLGMAEYERDLAGRSVLLVLPRVTPLSGLPDGLGRGDGDAGSTGLRRGPGERDALVREYQPGDPLRTVHWRSTARHDELMVRLEERPWHGGVTVLLDRRALAHRGTGAGSSLEWAIELVASVCHHLISRGRWVTLIGEDGVVLATGRDPDGLLDSLALLRPSVQPGLAPDVREDTELFAVLGEVAPAELGSLARQFSRGYAHAVLLDVAAWVRPEPVRPDTPRAATDPGPSAEVTAASALLTEAGWTVLAGTPSRRPDEVWSEFCRTLPIRLGTGR